MKLLSITIFASLFLFSCSSDDSGDGGTASGFAQGWTTAKIDEAVKKCEEGSGSTIIAVDCRCTIEETAKIVPFESQEEPTEAQATALAGALLNCLGSTDLSE